MNLVSSKKLLFFKVFLWIFSLEHWQHCRRSLPKDDFFSADVQNWRKNNWKQKMLPWKCSYGHVGSRFYKAPEKFLNFSLKVRKKILKKSRNFFEKIFVELYLRTRRIEFWWTCQFYFVIGAEVSCWMSRIAMKTFDFFKIDRFPSNCSYGHIEWSSEKPVGNFLSEDQKRLAECPKISRRKLFPMFFIKLFPTDT